MGLSVLKGEQFQMVQGVLCNYLAVEVDSALLCEDDDLNEIESKTIIFEEATMGVNDGVRLRIIFQLQLLVGL